MKKSLCGCSLLMATTNVASWNYLYCNRDIYLTGVRPTGTQTFGDPIYCDFARPMHAMLPLTSAVLSLSASMHHYAPVTLISRYCFVWCTPHKIAQRANNSLSLPNLEDLLIDAGPNLYERMSCKNKSATTEKPMQGEHYLYACAGSPSGVAGCWFSSGMQCFLIHF